MLEFGFEFLKSLNKFWVLSHLQIEVYRFLLWREQIKIVTWLKGIDGLFALRDYEVYDKQGEKIAAASSAWLILDRIRHRPQRIDAPDHPNYKVLPVDALVHLPPKIESPDLNQPLGNLTVKYSDLGINRHVNNLKYLLRNAFSRLKRFTTFQGLTECLM